jgi:hypothetical protein
MTRYQCADAGSIPNITIASGNTCEGEDGNVRDARTIRTIREAYLTQYEAKFNELKAQEDDGSGTKHAQISCLLGQMMNSIEQTYNNQDTSISTNLESEENHLNDQKRVIKAHKNSELVGKYREETSENRAKKLNTEFTIYVTFIVIFLIVEGIVFFV